MKGGSSCQLSWPAVWLSAQCQVVSRFHVFDNSSFLDSDASGSKSVPVHKTIPHLPNFIYGGKLLRSRDWSMSSVPLLLAPCLDRYTKPYNTTSQAPLLCSGDGSEGLLYHCIRPQVCTGMQYHACPVQL